MRDHPEEAGVQNYEPEFIPMLLRETEMAYKAESLGKSAQHDKAPGLGDTVNAAVAQGAGGPKPPLRPLRRRFGHFGEELAGW